MKINASDVLITNIVNLASQLIHSNQNALQLVGQNSVPLVRLPFV